MSTITVTTAQNIELEFPVAGIGERLLAILIDVLIILGYHLLIYLFVEELLGINPSTGFYQLISIPSLLYIPTTEILFNGQTIGKRLMNLRVVSMDGASPSMAAFIIRYVLALFEVFGMPVIALIAAGSTKKTQRLGDLAAGTTVVKMKLATGFEDTIFKEVEEHYELAFPEIQRLSDRDMSILKEVLDAGLSSKNPALLQKLSAKVKQVAGISSSLPDAKFLDTVLKDYNFLYGRE